MPLLKWDEKYNTGVEEMDFQHKKWMEVINRFYDNLNSGEFKENLSQLLDEAIHYTMYHFTQEEALMKKNNYPEYEEQKREHEKIAKQLFDYKTMLEEGRLNISQPVTKEMKEWFNSHITEMDKGYGPYMH